MFSIIARKTLVLTMDGPGPRRMRGGTDAVSGLRIAGGLSLVIEIL